MLILLQLINFQILKKCELYRSGIIVFRDKFSKQILIVSKVE